MSLVDEMMSPPEILIVAPVLGRPQNAAPLVESIAAATSVPWLLVFVCSPGDDDELEAVWAARQANPNVAFAVMDAPAGPADYAAKIQRGYDDPRGADAPFVLCAADDLRFHPGWDVEALAVAREFDVGVVGTNDLGNRQTVTGKHATHPLVSRCYIDSLGGFVGGEGQVYFGGYDHQFVDVELVETAKARGCYAPAPRSIVEHHHPFWGKSAMDDTYRKGQRAGTADRALFESRRHLWEREQVPA